MMTCEWTGKINYCRLLTLLTNDMGAELQLALVSYNAQQ